MSKFLTSIPLDINAVIKALPKNSYVHGVSFNKDSGAVELLWETERFETGLVVPVEFPLDYIRGKLLPDGVFDKTKKQPIPPKAPEPKVEPKLEQSTPAPVYLTEAQFTDSKTAGKAMEFQGIEPIWKPVDASHEFTAGFFYRLKTVDSPQKP